MFLICFIKCAMQTKTWFLWWILYNKKPEETSEKQLNLFHIQFHDLKTTFLTGLLITKLTFTKHLLQARHFTYTFFFSINPYSSYFQVCGVCLILQIVDFPKVTQPVKWQNQCFNRSLWLHALNLEYRVVITWKNECMVPLAQCLTNSVQWKINVRS